MASWLHDAALILALGAVPACSPPSAAPTIPPPASAPDAAAPPPSAAPPPPTSASAPPAASTPAGGADAGAADAGVADAGAARGPCPEGMALVRRFCIDRYEAQLWAPGPDGALAALAPNQRPPSGLRFEARSLPDVMPQGYISRVEAAAACKNAGKRLCSMAEWRRACQGPRRFKYPYGEHHAAGRCNHEKAHLLSIRYGANARHWTYEMFNDPSLDAEPGFLARTGEYTGCASDEGVYDMVGNLHEWVSDMVDADLVEKMEAEKVERVPQPWKEGNGVFMGGFFSTAEQHGPGCTFTTIAHEPTYHDYSIGFRCCAAADLPPPPPKSPRRRPR